MTKTHADALAESNGVILEATGPCEDIDWWERPTTTETGDENMTANIIHRTDTREVRKHNPSWPEYKDVEVGVCEIREPSRSLWQGETFIGCLTTRSDLVGYRVAK